jgi:hypothetical protein
MEHILKTWGNTGRFIIIITFIFVAILFLINKLSEHTQFNIDYTNDKTLITVIDKKMLLPIQYFLPVIVGQILA